MTKTMRILAFFFAILVVPALPFQPIHAQSDLHTVPIYFFKSEGCPHCAKEAFFLSQLAKEKPHIRIVEFEVGLNPSNGRLLRDIGNLLRKDVSGVPFTIIGNKTFSGFQSTETTGKELEWHISICETEGCPDPIAQLLPNNSTIGEGTHSDQSHSFETKSDDSIPPSSEQLSPDKTFTVPFIGTLNLKHLSLPILTVLLALIDGFNPCALWILLFLISLLLGMKQRTKMWALGSVFIASSAGVYALFMVAWLNILFFISVLPFVRIAVAALAFIAGGCHLYTLLSKPANGCSIVSNEKRTTMFARVRSILERKSFILSLLGIVGLAFAVNLIELLCSAGIPVVYTHILATTNLPTWRYYLYILLYILVFMLDDLLIFISAMVLLRMVGVTTKYVRTAQLIGGIIMILIGFFLIWKPEWLLFG